MSWSTDLFRKTESALDHSSDLATMAAESRNRGLDDRSGAASAMSSATRVPSRAGAKGRAAHDDR